FLEFVHPDDIKTTQELFEQVSVAGRVECFQNRLQHKNGLYHWLEWRCVSEGGYLMASACDITERKNKEEDTAKNKRFMEESHRMAKIGVWEIDLVNKKLLLNDFAFKIYGYHEIIENLSLDFFLKHIHPDDLEYAKKIWQETITNGKFSAVEYRIRSKDGEPKTIMIAGDMELGANKQPIRAFGIVQDITRQKEIENNLRASQKILNEAERIARMGSWQILLSNGSAIWSENLYKIHGMKEVKPELTPEWLMSAVHPDDRDKMAMNFQRNIERGFVENDEYRVVHPDGSVHILCVTGELIKDAGGPTGHMIGVTQDITERRQAEEKIQRLLAAIDQTTVQVIITDRNSKIEYVNNKFCQVTGYSREELIGRKAEFFSSDENEPGVQAEIVRCITKGENFKGELLNKNAKGELRWELVSITPIHNKSCELTNFISIKEDITGRKKLEKDLLEAKEKAEQSDKLKEAFLHNLSHEIRTPLNAVVGFSSLLQETLDNNPSSLSHYVQIIENSSNQLLSIMDDVLTIANIESGNEALEIELINVDKLLDDLAKLYEREAREKHLEFYCKFSSSLKPVLLKTDKNKLTKILSAFLSNALRFTHKGNIQLKSYLQNNFLFFSVSDTGIGIAKENQSVVFERFRQASPDIHIHYGGNGLGLAISRLYAKMLQAEIQLESELGKGSVFTLKVPYKAEIESQEIQTEKPVNELLQHSLKILIAEDEITNYYLLESILHRFNVEILHAQNGKEALEYLYNNPDIDLVLMDIKMPIMDGNQALEHIRKSGSVVPVIAQTAYASNHDRRECLNRGFTDFISKPISPATLIELVNKYTAEVAK
ncbi:MAG: PAS domain S-box protein, partial [Bacteroidales bacterium]|nr:PAS domain S-box protein [Bacteroidales bacterium]